MAKLAGRGAVLLAAVLALAPTACTRTVVARAAVATTTTIPEALWIGQANVWLGAHASVLKDISDAAKNLGDAAKAGNNNLVQIAVSQFIVKVGLADGTLPANAFGQDMHKVFVDYAGALGTIRKGILRNDQAQFKAGSDALAVAVAEFGTITKRMSAAP